MPKHPFPPATRRATPYRPPTREEIERARTMYAEGFTVSRVLAACDMSLGTLYYWLDGGPSSREVDVDGRVKPGHDDQTPQPASATLLPPIPRRRQVVGKRRRPLTGSRVSLTARLWRTAERQVRDIEERLARPGRPSPERERDTRMLSVLVRTLRDLSAFDAFDLTGEGAGGAGGEGEGAEPKPQRSLEELRASLARKLQQIIDEREPGAGGEAGMPPSGLGGAQTPA